jgi:diacylglycerol kinase family enzyme
VLAIVPGGHANVLAYALGIVRDPTKAATQVTDLFLNGHTQTIGLGLANNRWFAINAGLGIDAEIVSAVEDLRRRGLSASPATYIAGFMKSWAATDRWSGPMTIDGTGTDQEPQHVEGIVSTIIQNTAPWSMAGDLRLDGSQHASLNKGLDVVALQQLSTPTMMRIAGTLLTGKSIADLPETTVFADLNSIHITSQRPMPVQIDGDLSGSTTDIRFESVPQAVTVVASPQAPNGPQWPPM